ncbi:MAG: hypothetical protein ACHQ2F_02940 [Desulfobaccales bacterium]
MGIQIIKDGDEIISIKIDGEELETDDGESFITPHSLLINKNSNELPIGIRFDICDRVEEGVIYLDSMPLQLIRIDP